jgi:hypothetical protein
MERRAEMNVAEEENFRRTAGELQENCLHILMSLCLVIAHESGFLFLLQNII